MSIDWSNDAAIAIDGFTVGEIRVMVTDSVVPAKCSSCGAEHDVEPDARRYKCHECGAAGTVTSPLVKLRLI